MAHLDSWEQLKGLVSKIYESLDVAGKLVISYRDYGQELVDTQRFIPVRADDQKILTCVLDYEPDRVKVTDLLHEKTTDGWQQKASSYYKLRLTEDKVGNLIKSSGFEIVSHQNSNRMLYLVAQKPRK